MKFKTLIVVAFLIVDTTLYAQYFHFEQKPFLPVADTGKYKLTLLAGYSSSNNLNFQSSFSFTHRGYIFFGSNSQNGKRDWQPILGDVQTVELKNEGNFGGLGIILFTDNCLYNIAFGLEQYFIDNNIYFKSETTGNKTKAKYNNYFLEFKLVPHYKKRLRAALPLRVSYLGYDYLEYKEAGNQISDESFQKKNLKAIWLETGIMLNYNWQIIDIFYQSDFALPIESTGYRNTDLKGLRGTMNFGFQLIFDFKIKKPLK